MDEDSSYDYNYDLEAEEESLEEEEEEAEPLPSSASFFQLPLPDVVSSAVQEGLVESGIGGTSESTTVATAASASAAASADATKAAAERVKTRFVCGLLALTAYQHAICYRTFGSFPNMMTGHAIKLVEKLASGGIFRGGAADGCLFHCAMILSYTAGLSLFAHLKHHHTNTSSSSSSSNHRSNKMQLPARPSLLTRVARVAAGIYLLSDVVVWLAGKALLTGPASFAPRAGLAGLPLWAVSSGLINAATVDAVGVVTFAITGQLNKIGVGGTELLWLQGDRRDGTISSNAAAASSAALFDISWKGLGAFFAALLVTNVGMNLVGASPGGGGVLASTSLAWIRRLLASPPRGLTLAALYSALFFWYTSALTRHRNNDHREAPPR